MTLEKLQEREESLKKLLEQLVQQHTVISGQLQEIQFLIQQESEELERAEESIGVFE